MRLLRLNLPRAFVYPLTSPKRLLAACSILPLSLMLLVPPILMGLGTAGLVPMNLGRGLGLTLVVGAVCVAVGSIPFTLLAGYMLRCRKAVMHGENRLPAWAGVKELLQDGGRMDTLALCVAVPTMALFWGGLASLAGPIHHVYYHFSWSALLFALLGSGAGLFCLAMALVLWLTFMLLSPMATLRLALGATPFAALNPRGVLRDIGRGWFDYVLCCVLVWGASVGFSALQAAFWPLIVISFPAQVYLQLVWAHLLGQYANAYGLRDAREHA